MFAELSCAVAVAVVVFAVAAPIAVAVVFVVAASSRCGDRNLLALSSCRRRFSGYVSFMAPWSVAKQHLQCWYSLTRTVTNAMKNRQN
jgi:hypothetical protein